MEPFHIVQVGMGTNKTFLDYDYGIKALLQGTNKQPHEPLRAIGVDPVAWWTKKPHWARQASDNVRLIVGAVARAPGTRVLCGLPAGAREQLTDSAAWKRIGKSNQANVLHHLEYLEHMARLDEYHRDFEFGVNEIWKSMGRGIWLWEERPVTCYTFRQILEMGHASACEILHIDAEGADCEILESMGEFCCQGGQGRRWPRIIKFETRGFANTLFNPEKEDQTIGLLQWWKYNVVYSGNDTVLLHAPTMSRDRCFRNWADARYPLRCHRCPFATQPSHA